MSANDFTMQYALKLPNGELYHSAKPTTYSGLAYMFGAAAEELLDYMRKMAREVGVDNLGATIVQRMCSPFVAMHDDGADLCAQVDEWLRGQK